MFIKVFKLEGEEAVTNFTVGTHVIGRGPALQCNDKRVSRNHASLEVNEDKVKITSTHINPCFLKMANSKTVTILPKDSSSELNDGDAFAFLPHMFWFKIKIEHGEPSPTINKETEDKQGIKRHINSSDEETNDKRRKVEDDNKEPNSTDEGNKNNEQEATSSKKNAEPSNVKSDDQNEDNNVNDLSSNEQVNNNNEGTKKEETNKDDANDDAGIPSSTTNPRRLRLEICWYGAKCYRKNPAHRRERAHPGDSDFESDPDDNRPSCSYFMYYCYRKNKDHRRVYKHPPRGPPSKQKKRTRKKVDRYCAGDYDSEDLSDSSEDPFAADDSDEYFGDSYSDDSDEEDSQDLDEDSENVNRLVKEAKRFTKK